jgi:AcrR family transcriptional regulator
VTAVGETKAKILKVATTLFATQGYVATGVDDIGDALGISGPALYRHFANKQAILDEICVASFGTLLTEMKALIAEGGAPNDVLSRLIRMRVDFAYGPYGPSFAIRRANQDRLSQKAARTLAAMRDLYRSEWVRILAQIRPDVSTLELQIAVYAAHTLVGYGTEGEELRDEADHKRHLERMAMAVLLA